jgi:hypothetical protein
MASIQLFQALNQMRAAKQPFTVTFYKFSAQRGTGGQIETLVDVFVSGQLHGENTADYIAFRYDKSTTTRRVWIYSIREFNGQTVKLKP